MYLQVVDTVDLQEIHKEGGERLQARKFLFMIAMTHQSTTVQEI
jgi:hypothetical protein